MEYQEKSTQWFLYPYPMDGRKGMHSLERFIEKNRKRKTAIGEQFIFFNRRRDTVKLLRREPDGIALTELRGDHIARFVNDLQKRVADPELRKLLGGLIGG